jgi:hypothetical protein
MLSKKIILALLVVPGIFLSLATTSPSYTPAESRAGVPDSVIKPLEKQYLELNLIVKLLENEGDDVPGNYPSGLINVYNEASTLIAAIPFKHNKKFILRLPLDRQFKIYFTQDKFVSKFIEVNTRTPYIRRVAYTFPFYVGIFEAVTDLDFSVLENPIAKISFNNFNLEFDYDYNYTHVINSDIEKMQQAYYAKLELQKDSLKRVRRTRRDTKEF